jgi:UDP-N-acetylmuramate dehydrogenase
MQEFHNVSLASYTSLGVGGPAEKLVIAKSSKELQEILEQTPANDPVWVLGYGTNSLIADSGLQGTVVLTHGGAITTEDNCLVADSGVWWDDLVQASIEASSWGLELMSGIPGGVGAAVLGNIAAYGQAASDSLAWVELYNRDTQTVQKLHTSDLTFGYRQSSLQSETFARSVVLRVAFKISKRPTHQLTYRSALDIAERMNLTPDSLEHCRTIIMATRKAANALYDPDNTDNSKSAGSFFKNPMVEPDLAEQIMAYDETKRSLEHLKAQNQVHGGSAVRVSAAHVLLAAGFERGQRWDDVQLNPKHILKLQNSGHASAQSIYRVVRLIQQQVKEKLGIELQTEVRFLGNFEEL